MISLIFIGGLIVIALGLAARFYLDKTENELRIDNRELAVASAVMLLIVVPATAYVGTKLAISSQVTFNENWGGFETSTNWQVIKCTRDGPCRRCYDCDPYQVQVPYDCSYTTGSGKNQRRVSKTCYRTETRYHSCPYTTEEWTFTVGTTLGDYTIAAHNLPTNPDQHRWRARKSVPDYPSGIPPFWAAVKDRVDRDDPGPVVARREYDNYILASQNTILKRFSGDIERYKAAGMLPALNSSIHSFYFEDRVYFVGMQPAGDWQAAINRFDGALGITLQGDLHLVIVDANKAADPDNYSGALLAYWQSPAFEKQALSKNGIVVVLGTTEGRTVAWARAATGMPEGNEAMLVDIQNGLKGLSLDPATILGRPKASLAGGRVSVSHPEPQGALERIVWGDHAFKRVHMGKPGEKGNVGYSYLLREIEPTGWQRFWIIFLQVLFGCIAWGICIAHGAPAYRSYRSRY